MPAQSVDPRIDECGSSQRSRAIAFDYDESREVNRHQALSQRIL
jgi:hypothetical protein